MNSTVSDVARSVIDRCLCKRTRAAARAITRFYDDEMRATGLRPSQVEVLVTIAAKEELSISALSDELGMDRTTLTRNLRPLETKRLVASSPHGRTRIVHLTDAGVALLGEAVGHWERAQAEMERILGEAGVATVRRSSAAIASATKSAG